MKECRLKCHNLSQKSLNVNLTQSYTTFTFKTTLTILCEQFAVAFRSITPQIIFPQWERY